MKIIKPSIEIITPISETVVLKHIECCGRVCYKSEDRIADGSAEDFVRMLILRGHESVLEHYTISVRLICDKGVSHELVRHRLASYSQESTRYCNYRGARFGGEITVIEPCFLKRGTHGWQLWEESCLSAEKAYFDLLNWGCTPQEARAVLPMSLKTEIIMTANIREWRHFLQLRCAPNAHPQMREVASALLKELQLRVPVCFSDIAYDR